MKDFLVAVTMVIAAKSREEAMDIASKKSGGSAAGAIEDGERKEDFASQEAQLYHYVYTYTPW